MKLLLEVDVEPIPAGRPALAFGHRQQPRGRCRSGAEFSRRACRGRRHGRRRPRPRSTNPTRPPRRPWRRPSPGCAARPAPRQSTSSTGCAKPSACSVLTSTLAKACPPTVAVCRRRRLVRARTDPASRRSVVDRRCCTARSRGGRRGAALRCPFSHIGSMSAQLPRVRSGWGDSPPSNRGPSAGSRRRTQPFQTPGLA